MTGTAARTEIRIGLDTPELALLVAGPGHRNLALVEDAFGVRADTQGGDIRIAGSDPVALEAAGLALGELAARAAGGVAPEPADARAAIAFARGGGRAGRDGIALPGRGRKVSPRTPAQAAYLDALAAGEADLVFGIGPAGTGKTYLAAAIATALLLEGKVARIIVTRPAVEAGERLGFLPGDLEEKVDPYMAPIWDAFRALLGQTQLERRKAAGEIEVAPLAFMRGRTLSDAFVIVDEAQNTTRMQMRMLLTRLGEGSRMAVNGDPSQVDLPRPSESGLADALRVLDGVTGVRVVAFSSDDVVRHTLVGRIVAAYEADARRGAGPPAPVADVDGSGRAPGDGLSVASRIEAESWAAALTAPAELLAQGVADAVADLVETGDGEVALLWTDDARMQALNARWRGRDAPTNVLSFPAGPGAPDGFLGDVAIALETCQREAAAAGIALDAHVRHLVAHGVLHLMGYDHTTDAEAAEMEGLERDVLARLGVADPYANHDG